LDSSMLRIVGSGVRCLLVTSSDSVLFTSDSPLGNTVAQLNLG
jgi:hypothetical protein